MNRVLVWTMLLCGLLLTGCDKLDDSDDGMVREILPGKWAFSYTIKSDQDPGLDFEYKNVIFNEDGSCAITYIDTYEMRVDENGNPVLDENGDIIYDPVMGALTGTYVASSSMIRIVSRDIGDEEQVLIWRIVSLSEKQVVAEYDFSINDSGSMTAIVTLDRQ